MEMRGYLRATGLTMAYLLAIQLTFPLLAPYFKSLGYSEAWIGVVFAIFPFVSMLFGVIVGELADHVGRSWMLRVAFLLMAVAYGGYYSGLAWAIIAARVLDAIALTALTVLLMAKAEDTLDDHKRGKMTGILLSLQHIVRLAGPVAGGFLADMFIGYPFFISIGIFVALTFALRKSKYHVKTSRLDLHPLKDIRLFWDNNRLRPMMIIGPAMHATGPLFGIVLPLMIVDQLGMPYVYLGLALTVYGSAHLVQFAFGDLADRVGRVRVLLAGTGLYAVTMIVVGLTAPSYTAFLVLLFIAGVGGSMWNVTAWSFMSEVAEKHNMENRVVGTYMSVAKAGQTVSFLLTGVLLAFVGYSGVWIVFGIVAFAGTGISALMWLSAQR